MVAEKAKSKTKAKSKSKERKLNTDSANSTSSGKSKKIKAGAGSRSNSEEIKKGKTGDAASIQSSQSHSVTKKKAGSRSNSADLKKGQLGDTASIKSNQTRLETKRKTPKRSKSDDLLHMRTTATQKSPHPEVKNLNDAASVASSQSMSVKKKVIQRSKSDEPATLKNEQILTSHNTPSVRESTGTTSHHSRETPIRKAPQRSKSAEMPKNQNVGQHIISQEFSNHISSQSNLTAHLPAVRGRSRSPTASQTRPTNLNHSSHHPPPHMSVRGRSVSRERGPPVGGYRDRSMERPRSMEFTGQRGMSRERYGNSDLAHPNMRSRSRDPMDRSGHSRGVPLPSQRGRSIERGDGPMPRGPSMDRSVGGAPQVRGRSMDRSDHGPPIRGRSADRSVGGPPIRGPSTDRSVGAPPIRGRSRSVDRSVGGPPIRGRSRSADRSVGGPPIRGRSMDRSGHSRGDGPPIRGRSRSMDRSVDRGRSRSREPIGHGSIHDHAYSMNHSDQGGHPSLGLKKLSLYGRLDRDELNWKKICSYVIPISVLVGCAVGLITFTGNVSKITPPAFRGQLFNEDLSDPFAGNNGVPSWPSTGNGIQVTVINALTSEWRTAFTLATADWDYGTPDAVDLILEDASEPEFACIQEPGKVKVCNGDHGDTKWRGICEVTTTDEGKLSSASARMNDYYLAAMDEGAWQYTMCHELGHALGLGHTDENFNNPDLGNCLDYTDNLDDNKHPDEGLYETLLELYGPAPGSTDEVRNLRGQRQKVPTIGQTSSIFPNHLREKRELAVQKLLQQRDDNAREDGWKLLHRTEHGEAHELDLGGGYKVQVHMLLARDV